jgi:hypothetical protein
MNLTASIYLIHCKLIPIFSTKLKIQTKNFVFLKSNSNQTQHESSRFSKDRKDNPNI